MLDIALLPAYRRRGIGSRLMREVMERAQALGVPLSLHVYKGNGGEQRFYEHLGPRIAGDVGAYWFLEWRGEQDQGAGGLAPCSAAREARA